MEDKFKIVKKMMDELGWYWVAPRCSLDEGFYEFRKSIQFAIRLRVSALPDTEDGIAQAIGDSLKSYFGAVDREQTLLAILTTKGE